ncbi:MAG: preprotein translocase subunit SecG [Anaerolineae bacterium]|nr:preprotein translocase subunit SecG [Anaerolineae bacterium]MCB9132873.1 preprotein translocase subunit SecG [Anaerolineales bacterium]MCB0230576.1 preprotein translocase subunit SecG [Anaerolineae bacterium]MCB0234340.1 preprotein translocase subunit SecG [Anaerolineae bacterium]MCB0248958.1 preprotein translocase subunit SecG [Anaerolineae bacterium]
MTSVLYVVQVILGITLIGLVTVQAKGMGAGAMFGGDTSFKTSKRGFERTLFNLTVAVSAVFFLVALITVSVA